MVVEAIYGAGLTQQTLNECGSYLIATQPIPGITGLKILLTVLKSLYIAQIWNKLNWID